MKLRDSELFRDSIESYQLEIGNLYLFENIAISEINEGKHLCVDTADDYVSILSDFYGTAKPFAYISNRVNSFSIAAIDFPKFVNVLKNLKAFSTVSYRRFDEMNIQVEKQFCKLPYKKFKSLIDAYKIMNDYIINDLSSKTLKTI
ncbi:hypothetical protein [uncultured Lacinutrix sp.]|uniref:hypothetical protein n=1 Tax=uncultured Lacinutrix sp. TaxID=574032 RepID=UPI00261974F0|nr:hypothetical protein [uncultured Lacinutrix sp.]